MDRNYDVLLTGTLGKSANSEHGKAIVELFTFGYGERPRVIFRMAGKAWGHNSGEPGHFDRVLSLSARILAELFDGSVANEFADEFATDMLIRLPKRGWTIWAGDVEDFVRKSAAARKVKQ